jgi:hypothetical protein
MPESRSTCSGETKDVAAGPVGWEESPDLLHVALRPRVVDDERAAEAMVKTRSHDVSPVLKSTARAKILIMPARRISGA